MTKQQRKQTAIHITKSDYERLSALIEKTRETDRMDRENLKKLEAELDRAEVVEAKDISKKVITMRSTVRLKDLVSGEANTYSLVFPSEPAGTRHVRLGYKFQRRFTF